MEKIVTETYKEVIKEAPTQPAGESKSTTSADDVLEKLSNLLDYELEKRKAADAAAATASTAESVPAFAKANPDPDDDAEDEDELEEDEDELDDSGEATEESDNNACGGNADVLFGSYRTDCCEG